MITPADLDNWIMGDPDRELEVEPEEEEPEPECALCNGRGSLTDGEVEIDCPDCTLMHTDDKETHV